MLTKIKGGYSISMFIPYTESEVHISTFDVNDLLNSFTTSIQKGIEKLISSIEVAVISSTIIAATKEEIIYTDSNNREHRLETSFLYDLQLTSKKLSSTMFEELDKADLENILFVVPSLEDNEKYSVLKLQQVVIHQLKALCHRM